MRERGAISNLLAVVLGTSAAGLVVGAVLNVTGVVDLSGGDTAEAIAAPATASYYDCPDGAALGVLGQGDRVFLTARDDSGTWVELRSPASSDARVWMRARQVVPDGDTSGLPERDCLVAVGVILDEETTTTTSTTSTTTTSTTTTTTLPPTTTTVPAPSVSASSQHSEIRSRFPQQEICHHPVGPWNYTTQITAQVNAPAGVALVTIQWSSTVYSGGPVPMSPSGNGYTYTLGPYESNQFGENQSTPVTVTVTVTDALNRTASSQLTVTLRGCAQ